MHGGAPRGVAASGADVAQLVARLDAVSRTAEAPAPEVALRPGKDWRALLVLTPRRPLELFRLDANAPREELLRRAAALLAGEGAIPPALWPVEGGGAAYLVHGWTEVEALAAAYDLAGDPRVIDAVLAYAEAWLTAFFRPARRIGPVPLRLADVQGLPVWYDMAVAHRTHLLAWLLDAVARDNARPAVDVARLEAALLFHLEILARDDFLAAHTNHGLFQALAQLAAARRFLGVLPVEAAWRMGLERTAAMVTAQFSPTGIHREHSFEYHLRTLAAVLVAVDAGLIARTAGDGRLAQAEAALAWMIAPGGRLAPIGDSHPLQAAAFGPDLAARFQHAEARARLSSPDGGAAEQGVRAYPDDGVVFARMTGDGRGETYFAQAAAFHSRTHKQADHLAFVWHDRGRPILADPGRFAYLGRTAPGDGLFEAGFWYADPRRIYVESTRAHTALEIDGHDHQRRGTRPFGSALVAAGEQGGMAFSDCAIVHARAIRHRRIVVLKPGRFLLLLDWMQERRGAPHDYRQWFCIDPAWSVSARQGGFSLVQDGLAADERLALLPLFPGAGASAVTRGETQPRLQGWISPGPEELVPAPSVHFRGSGAGIVLLGALFCYGADAAVDPRRTRANLSLSRLTARWRDASGDNAFSLARGIDGALSLQHSAVSA